MQPKKYPVLLFSDTADAETATLVRRIPGKHDRFATDFIGVEGQVAVRLEAWRNSGTHAWAIDRLTYAPTLGRLEKTVEARPGLCFFDALYHCARFQATELAAHEDRRVVSVRGWKSPVSYRDAAEAARQIIDDDGVAHPCAQGRILTTGMFSEADMVKAAGTEGRALVPAAEQKPDLFSDLLTVNREPVSGTCSALARYGETRAAALRDRAHSFQITRMLSAGNALQAGLKEIAQRHFELRLPAWKTGLTLGLAPAIGYLNGDIRYANDRHFFSLKKAFDHSAAALTDGQDKTAALQLAAAAESAYWMERALHLIRRNEQSDRHSEEIVKRAFAYVDRAGRAAGLSPLDIERVKSGMLEGSFPGGSFVQKLKNRWDEYQRDALARTFSLDPVLEVGQITDDGSLFGGLSPTTNSVMFVATEDFAEATWVKMSRTIAKIDYCGHRGSRHQRESELLQAMRSGNQDHGWRMPTVAEYQYLFEQQERGVLSELHGSFNWTCTYAGRSILGKQMTAQYADGQHDFSINNSSFRFPTRPVRTL